MKIIQEKMTTIRQDNGKLVAIVETDMTRRAQIVHITSEVGVEEMKGLLENLTIPEEKNI